MSLKKTIIENGIEIEISENSDIEKVDTKELIENLQFALSEMPKISKDELLEMFDNSS